MKGKYNRESSIKMLIDKQKSLADEGLTRYPQRCDFESREIIAIKAFLGPWPRALEAAGLKPPRSEENNQRKKESNRINKENNRRNKEGNIDLKRSVNSGLPD